MTRRVRIPRDPLLTALTAAAILETAWTVYIGFSLPRHYVASHWRLAWVGLDVGEVFALLAAAWAAWKRRAILALFTSSAGTMLLVDAWFDITTARRGDQLQSSLTALLIEVPSAIALYWVTQRTIRQLNRSRMDEAGVHSVRHLPLDPIDPRRERPQR